jgi:hypothetical protein
MVYRSLTSCQAIFCCFRFRASVSASNDAFCVVIRRSTSFLELICQLRSDVNSSPSRIWSLLVRILRRTRDASTPHAYWLPRNDCATAIDAQVLPVPSRDTTATLYKGTKRYNATNVDGVEAKTFLRHLLPDGFVDETRGILSYPGIRVHERSLTALSQIKRCGYVNLTMQKAHHVVHNTIGLNPRKRALPSPCRSSLNPHRRALPKWVEDRRQASILQRARVVDNPHRALRWDWDRPPKNPIHCNACSEDGIRSEETFPARPERRKTDHCNARQRRLYLPSVRRRPNSSESVRSAENRY